MALFKNSNSIVRLLQLLLAPVLDALTPTVREFFEAQLDALYFKAEETENEIDDLFVEMLFKVLDKVAPEGGGQR